MKERVRNEAAKEGTENKLVSSLAPEIFGMQGVKRSLLYQMVGGSMIRYEDGLKIRGDLNIALIGDPGVAKSQLLKQIAFLTPRSVYTTGKGSSGAGLTASVFRDKTTGEISLEGGALVLSDLGICCIDEFDKMEESDRTSIHEVMEQQTISLAKAGITTSLNARTSILAAANPIWGRYNRKKTPHENIGLPHSLLSRFDLIFILLDNAKADVDLRMAEHITNIHQQSALPEVQNNVYEDEFLRAYVSLARTFNPIVSYDIHEFIIGKYIDRRRENAELGKYGQYITPRSLLGIIRFAQASAKLRLSDEVTISDVENAVSLIDDSLQSLQTESDDIGPTRRRVGLNPTNIVSTLLRDSFKSARSNHLTYSKIYNAAIAKGLVEEQINQAFSDLSLGDMYIFNKIEDFIEKIN